MRKLHARLGVAVAGALLMGLLCGCQRPQPEETPAPSRAAADGLANNGAKAPGGK